MIDQNKKSISRGLSILLSFVLIISHLSTGNIFAAHDDREIYSLATDRAVQEIALGVTGDDLLDVTPNLNRSGSPTLTIVEHPHGGNSIQVSERGATHHAIDIARTPLGLEVGNRYTIAVSGRMVDDEQGTQVIIGGSDSPWNWLANTAPNADGSFSVTLTVNHEILSHPQVERGFRIQTNNFATFIIDEIVVTYIGIDNTWTPPGEGPTTIPPQVYGSALRVETMAHQQWDGVQIPHTALELEAGNVYEFTMDVMVPHVPAGGIGLVLQTNGSRWEHIIFTGTLDDEDAGEWRRISGTLDLSNDTTLDFTNIQLVKDGDGPNENENTVFFVDNFAVERVNQAGENTLIRVFDFENDQTAPFVQSGTALLSIVSVIPKTPILHLTFGDDWSTYEAYSSAGSQMEGERVINFGRTDDYAFRLENVTGDYTSGAGNYFRLNLPEPLLMGGTYEISWWVYVPVDENPGNRNIIGPGLVFNSTFGSPAHQPTNTQPAPGDVQRRTPMGEWVQTSVVFDLDHRTGDVEHLIFRFRVNDNIQQPTVYFIDDIEINSLGSDDSFVVPEWDLTLPSLHELYSDFFLFGNILEPSLIQNNPRNVINMFLHHYNTLTAENAMKPDAISGGGLQVTRPDALLLDNAETMVRFAEDNDLYMVGHTLIWHQQSASWLYRDPVTNEMLKRSEAMENMRWFIEQYAGHFDGRIDAWDVTNEVFTNSGGANNVNDNPAGGTIYPVGSWQRTLRNYASWYQAFANGADVSAGECGSDYIYYSYVFARRYAPTATLIYNDFNEEFPAKRDAIASMVEELNERFANDAINNPAYNNPNHPDYGRLLIEAVGMQAHYNQNTNMDDIRQALDRFIETGARIHVTELDIQFTNIASPFEMSPAQLEEQATRFAQLFVWYMERADHIDRVSIWGREDASSWRGHNGATHFDRHYNPKPAYWAIVDPIGWLVERGLMEAPTVLEAPGNLQIDDDGILTWDEVAHARGYRVYVDGLATTDMLVGARTTASFDLTTLELPVGTHEIQVRAIGNRVSHTNSELSDILSYVVEAGDSGSSNEPILLATPVNLQIDDDSILTWDEVAHARGYRVYVDGLAVTDVLIETHFDLTTLDLAVGAHEIQVRAIGDGTDYTDSELSSPVAFRVVQNEEGQPGENDDDESNNNNRLPNTGYLISTAFTLGILALVAATVLVKKKQRIDKPTN